MPDTRSHRGAHPEDATLFGHEQWPALREAAAELGWLLDRGYALRSALALVGDRHNLTQRQRIGLARTACAAVDASRRAEHRIEPRALGAAEVWIDGYNLLITIEAALGGGVILRGRDGCFRDLASLHGTYRSVEETEPALRLIGDSLAAWGVARCRWIIDRPVSNSGRLKERILALAESRGWSWDVDLEFSPDAVLAKTREIVATCDSVILNRCAHWVDAARSIVTEKIPTAFVVDVYPERAAVTADRSVEVTRERSPPDWPIHFEQEGREERQGVIEPQRHRAILMLLLDPRSPNPIYRREQRQQRDRKDPIP